MYVCTYVYVVPTYTHIYSYVLKYVGQCSELTSTFVRTCSQVFCLLTLSYIWYRHLHLCTDSRYAVDGSLDNSISVLCVHTEKCVYVCIYILSECMHVF